MKKDNRVKPDARTECDSTGSRAAQCSAAHVCANCNSPAKYKCSECGKMFCDDCCALDADREVTVCTECFCKPPNDDESSHAGAATPEKH